MSELTAFEGEAQHILLVNEAEMRGLNVSNISEQYGKAAVKIWNEHQEVIIVQGIVQNWLNDSATQICDHKDLTKELFTRLSIPSPSSFNFDHPNDLDSALFEFNNRYVCKPSFGTNGIGVCTEIYTFKDVENYFKKHGLLNSTHLLEPFISGYDLRIQVVNRKPIAACIRKPAYVIGDGKSNLNELIQARVAIVQSQNPANDLKIDDESYQLIKSQELSISSIVAKDQEVQLKKISNMAQGGHAIDVTDQLDPIIGQWIDQISNELKVGYYALDLMTLDHSNFLKGKTTALEINIRAEWLHHTFSDHKTHDLARDIIQVLFPL